jgi:hypothetical protein
MKLILSSKFKNEGAVQHSKRFKSSYKVLPRVFPAYENGKVIFYREMGLLYQEIDS